MQEHHTTIMLLGEYHEWQTERERGRFPKFDETNPDWRHLNDDYTPGPYIEATGPDLPRVRMDATEKLPLRPTPITTGVQQSSRVLQALRTPEAGGVLRFEPGMHPYFAGRIVVAGD